MSNSALGRELKGDEAKLKGEAVNEVRSFRRTAVGGWITLMYHFVTAQCRPIYTFYFSYQAYCALFIGYEVTNIVITDAVEKAARAPTNMTFAAYSGCVMMDTAAMMTTWKVPMETKCIGTIGHQLFKFAESNRVYTGLNWFCEALCVIFVIIMAIELVRSGARHVGHGKYIAFTWKVENSVPHKICAGTLIFFCVLMVADFVRFLVLQYLAGTLMSASPFIQTILPAIGGLIHAATSLFKPAGIPKFDWESETFQEMHVFRKLGQMHVSNADFYHEIVHAVHEAERGNSSALDAFCAGDGWSTKEQIAASFQIKDKYQPLSTA